ncbi:MAG: hypothetical protein IJC15_07135, partial [Clostridia bacterium]|nr:hypothetical protein [Clostridia bacterium]
LGCDDTRRTKALAAFKKQYHACLNRGDTAGRLALARAMQKDYPNEEIVLRNLMAALYTADRKGSSAEIIALGERLLTSVNNDHRHTAIRLLCYTHNAIGEKEKALEYADMIPIGTDLRMAVLEGEELAEHCRWRFYGACDKLQLVLRYLLQCPEAGYTAAERHQIRTTMCDFYRMIFSDGDFGFWHDRLGELCFGLALSSAELGETDRAFAELEEMFEHFTAFENFTSIDHTSPLVRGLHYDIVQSGRSGSENNFSITLRRLKKNPLFDSIREDTRFAALCTRLAEHAKA